MTLNPGKNQRQLLPETKKVIPGGVNSPVRSFAVPAEHRLLLRGLAAAIFMIMMAMTTLIM